MTKNNNPTEDEIVETLLEGLEEDDLDRMRRMEEGDLISLHHSFGRFLRNTYRLWDRPWEPEIKDGCDYSPNHPDAVSMRIIHKLHARLLNDE